MASEEPLFDPSLKKRKKKAVAFTEDPLGADADPTAPAPDTIDNTTTTGEAVDLGPTTAHEQMKMNGEEGTKDENEDYKAMFGDLKKKKKKKEIPMDLVSRKWDSCCPPISSHMRSGRWRFRNVYPCRWCFCSSDHRGSGFLRY